MILTTYIIILTYFLVGYICFYFINRKRDTLVARKSWKKTNIYFLIINILALSIVINPVAFRCLAVLIIFVGFYELFKLFKESGYMRKDFFLLSILIFALFSFVFFIFSGMERELIFYVFAILSIFDSFSEITGHLLGRKKLFPKISPNKTVEGFIGGTLVAIISAIFLKGLISIPLSKAITLAAGVVVFAFIGDASTSYYKRKYGVKDFSNLIPEHGGFLDRFDSLIAGGAWVTLFGLLTSN